MSQFISSLQNKKMSPNLSVNPRKYRKLIIYPRRAHIWARTTHQYIQAVGDWFGRQGKEEHFEVPIRRVFLPKMTIIFYSRWHSQAFAYGFLFLDFPFLLYQHGP